MLPMCGILFNLQGTVYGTLEAFCKRNLRPDFEYRMPTCLRGNTNRARILAPAADFPNLWKDPCTPQRERKRTTRPLIEDVTLMGDHQVTVHVPFRGGAVRTGALPLPLPATGLWRRPRN